MRLWPRLPSPVARVLLEEFRGLTLADLTARAALEHPAQTFAATGGSRADAQACAQLRAAIIQTASLAGYPSKSTNQIAFDRSLAVLLADAMPMAVAEASNRHVWNFTTLVLAPDVTAWRFGFNNSERWLCSDMTRHMYSRLWWHAALLVDRSGAGTDSALLRALTESDLNQLLERSSLGGCRPLVRALAQAVVTAPGDVPRRALIRDVAARLLRDMAVIDHLALSSDEIEVAVRGAVDHSIRVLRDLDPQQRLPPA